MNLPTATLGKGNIKLGPVPNFSLPSKLTCPGASPWCMTHCYAFRFERLRPNCGNAYSRNLVLSWDQDEFVAEVLHGIPRRAESMRIHVSGDFCSVDYIRAWIHICRNRPNTRFWSYTRSWMKVELIPSLERLRNLPNVQLFASIDPTMPNPPAHWRKAYIDVDTRAHGLPCPEQLGKSPSCLACGYCFRNDRGNVVLKVH